jgi:hypothetical protein
MPKSYSKAIVHPKPEPQPLLLVLTPPWQNPDAIAVEASRKIVSDLSGLLTRDSGSPWRDRLEAELIGPNANHCRLGIKWLSMFSGLRI